MPGNSPTQAVEAFTEPIKNALTCVFDPRDCYLLHKGDLNEIRALTFNKQQPMWATSNGQPQRQYALVAGILYSIIEDDQNGPYRCTTHQYIYDLIRYDAGDPAGATMLAWHWHAKFSDPHLHIEPGGASGLDPGLWRAHIPTARVTLEDILMFMIRDLGVTPRCTNWREIIEPIRETHVEKRTWHHRPSG